MNTRILIALATLACAPSHADIIGPITDVHDGDTITLASGERVRLYGIDAPELDQPYGREAREALVASREVRVIERNRDRYGRIVVNVYDGETNANDALVRVGAAWCYVKYLPPDSDCPAIEADARVARRGL